VFGGDNWKTIAPIGQDIAKGVGRLLNAVAFPGV
jgi:hypothetical protein